MSAQEPLKKIVRPLREWEKTEAHKVFGETIIYEQVRVHEGVSWPDMANKLGMWLKHIPQTEYMPNAITLGNHCYFPVNFPETQAEWDHWRFTFGWLIHELTHVWQYQHEGWSYLYRALAAQFRLKDKAYDFGEAAGLIKAAVDGRTMAWFNPEQQGAIAQKFYDYARSNRDVSAWIPFVNEIKSRV